jgi:murein L,D-transpeptidase YcbB/YkuD
MLPPGPRNPLGPVRIGLEDSQGVFLHGTSEPGLFARAGRTLSHGCVRVERAVELAAWMLDWTPEALRAVIATGRTIELVPPREVRVVLAYLTAWPVADGRGGAMLELRADPYRLDRGCPADPGAGARRAASG